MPEPESDPGFTFVDRRRRVEDPPPPREAAPAPRPAPSSPPSEQVGPVEGPPRPDLASLCVMLFSDAMVHLGQVPDPVTGRPQPDLGQARYAIDLLTMIKEKTEGNRTSEESAILDEVLTALRMGFVRASRLS